MPLVRSLGLYRLEVIVSSGNSVKVEDGSANGTSARVGRSERMRRSNSRGWSGWMRAHVLTPLHGHAAWAASPVAAAIDQNGVVGVSRGQRPWPTVTGADAMLMPHTGALCPRFLIMACSPTTTISLRMLAALSVNRSLDPTAMRIPSGETVRKTAVSHRFRSR